MRKLLQIAGLLLVAGISQAAETSYDTIPTCPVLSTTTRVSVSSGGYVGGTPSPAATQMFSTSTYGGGVRVVTIQNLDATVNLWCNYGSCVSTDTYKACVGLRVVPYGTLTLPLTPVQDPFPMSLRGQPYCVNDGTASSNAVISLCR